MRILSLALVVAAVAAAVGAAWWLPGSDGAVAAHVAAPAVFDASYMRAKALSESEAIDDQIARYEQRVAHDPGAAADRAALAGLCLQRSRVTGNAVDVSRAESYARESLFVRGKGNSRAVRLLAATLLAQHRFSEALEVARELVRVWPEDPAHRALLAEVQMELGDYSEAGMILASLESSRDNLAVAPRFARWAWLTGQPEEERRISYAARDKAEYRLDFSQEEQAWYQLRVGDAEMRAGNLVAAGQALHAGLEVFPGDHRILAALARLSAVRQDWPQAIRYGEEAISVVLDPATLGIIGDAYAALGNSARAEEYFATMEVAVGDQSAGQFHREWTLFLLDHDRQPRTVLQTAASEIRKRPDVYGYDLLAWALHKNGRNREARRAMQHAFAQNTLDASLFFHAGIIERALGDNDAAAKHLERALAINPYFHHRNAATAQAVLDTMRDEMPLWSRLLLATR